MMKKVLLVHYGEIWLKGKNRKWFVDHLRKNIAWKLGIEAKEIKHEDSRLVMKFVQPLDGLEEVFGISWWTEAELIPDLQFSIFKKYLSKFSFKTFGVRVRRMDKSYPKNSNEIAIEVGDLIRKEFQTKVDLTNPDLWVNLDITQKGIYLWTKKNKGLRGMPVGSGGKLLCLLSGGIDSPVAAWLMQKRGAEVEVVHFHSYPQTTKASIDKVKKLVKILEKYQKKVNVHQIELLPIQKEILKKADKRAAMLLYRRAMMKIASGIAEKRGCLGLVTGESWGQVASQTGENMLAVSEGLNFPIYRSVIAMDKEEIVNLAKKIGSYETSILPHEDCCTLLTPRDVFTRISKEKLLTEEKKVDKLSTMIKQVYE